MDLLPGIFYVLADLVVIAVLLVLVLRVLGLLLGLLLALLGLLVLLILLGVLGVVFLRHGYSPFFDPFGPDSGRKPPARRNRTRSAPQQGGNAAVLFPSGYPHRTGFSVPTDRITRCSEKYERR